MMTSKYVLYSVYCSAHFGYNDPTKSMPVEKSLKSKNITIWSSKGEGES